MISGWSVYDYEGTGDNKSFFFKLILGELYRFVTNKYDQETKDTVTAMITITDPDLTMYVNILQRITSTSTNMVLRKHAMTNCALILCC